MTLDNPDHELLEILHGDEVRARDAAKIRRATAATQGSRPRQQPQPEEPKRAKPSRLEVEAPVNEPRQRFPIAALPVTVRAFCTEAAQALQAEPDMLALFALGHISGAIGYTRVLDLKRGWQPAANLWIAAVADAGLLKTPSLKAAGGPLDRHQEALLDRYDEAERVYQQELGIWERATTAERGGKPVPPQARQHTISDITVESLVTLLNRSPRGLILSRDELSGWIRGMGEYKGGGGHDRADWLSTWSMAKLIVNRQRAELSARPLSVWRPWVAICGGLQPFVLAEMRANESQDDGMMDRFLFGFPSAVQRKWNRDTISRDTQDAYEEMFQSLLNLEMDIDQVSGKLFPRAIPMSPEAVEAWEQMYNEHHAEVAAPDFDTRLSGAWSKFDEQAARIILVLYCARVAEGTVPAGAIDVGSVLNGWAITAYFKWGAKHARDIVTADSASEPIERIVAYMTKKQITSLTLRDMVSAHLVKEATIGRELFYRMVDRAMGDVDESYAGSRLRLTFTLSTEWLKAQS